MRKRKKVEFAHWPVRCGVVSVTRNNEKLDKTTTAPIKGEVGDEVAYQIVGGLEGGNEIHSLQRVYDTDKNTPGHQEDYYYDSNNPNRVYKDQHAFSYSPHGVDDVDNMTISIRENVDALFVFTFPAAGV